MSKFIVTAKFVEALAQAGVITEPLETVRRVVIDLEHGRPGMIYVERFADDKLLAVALKGGIEITSDREAASRMIT